MCVAVGAKGVRFNAYIENALWRKFHLQLCECVKIVAAAAVVDVVEKSKSLF